jgi:malectin (di-glucose binding ER protein)/Big-like domain-containing protein
MFAGLFKDGTSGSVVTLSSPGVDNFNVTHPLFQWVAQLNNFRRLYPAIALGTHVNQWNNPSGPGLFAYSRVLNTQEVFVVFNSAGSSQTLPSRTLTYPAGTVLLNLLNTNETYTLITGGQTPAITVPAVAAKIFIAQSQWQPLDPVVVSSSPAHWTTNAPTFSPIVLQFSKSMDTNSVQNAFSMTPPLSGSFTWSAVNAANDTMTFTPSAAGLPGSTLITVRVTNTAIDSVSGNALYSPYQMQFRTMAASTLIPPTIVLQTPTNGAVITGNLQISGTASDTIGVQKVEVQLDNGSWTTAAGTTSWSLNLNSSNFLNGPHVISARATDTSGNVSNTPTFTVRFFNVPGNYVQRMSGGNPTNVTDCSGNVWLEDTNYSLGAFGFVRGTNGYLNNSIKGVCTSAQSLYQREHYSTSSNGFYYQFDCPEGVYQITLLEAETYWSGPGKREFNVFIQGRQVLTNFDIYATTGEMNVPLTLLFTNSVTNSQMQILFTPVLDNARVSGVQISKIADVFSDTDGIPDWWRLAYFGHALGQAGDKSRGSDDADGDGVSNLTEYLNGTDPLNPASFPTLPPFNITHISVTASNVQLSCPTVTNWSFQLRSTSSLGVGFSWSNSGPAFSGTGGTITFIDGSAPGNRTRYYRVQAR